MSAGRWIHVIVRRIAVGGLTALVAVAQPHGQSRPSVTTPSDLHPNFDIRSYKNDPSLASNGAVTAYMTTFAPPRAGAAKALASGRPGLAALRAARPGVRVEEHLLGGPAVVSAMPGTPLLSQPGADRVATLRGFLQSQAPAFGLAGDQAASLVVRADEVNPAGNMAWVELEQHIHGIPVFQGFVRGAFTAKGELARTSGMLATGLDGVPAQTPALSSAQAAAIAAANVNMPASAAASARTWQTYFPLATGVARLAWTVEVLSESAGFMSVIDATTGTVLFRKNLVDAQTQPATYSVYTSDSPAPASPTPALPGANYVAPVVARQTVAVIGNEGVNAFNNLGWITDGANLGNGFTDGNNVEAGIDRDGIDGVDAPVAGTARTFNFAYNPPPGSPAPGDDPVTNVDAQRGEVVNMFYWTNRFHDDTYRLGFTEAFFNFQNDNFGRGGAGGDRISAETQDGSGANNANFATLADGGRGRMQMFLWTGPTPDHGGGLDADIMIHELTHGLSNRLHANATGLTTNMARGMGEGWSDFYARALLADASEPVDGLYTVGGWATKGLGVGFESYYYGIRKFPYAVMTSVGANGRPHNPMTFADIDATQSNFTNGAHPANPYVGFGAARDQVHEIGQIWAMMLFEARARFITRLGFEEGNRRILQFVTDGMKGDPLDPTMLQARDSIIAAANAGGGTPEDIADLWSGFAVRGLGVGASIENAGTGGNTTRVTESFRRPGDPVPTFSINDVSLTEGHAGLKTFTFTVSLASPDTGMSRVTVATANGTATAASSSLVGTSTGTVAIPAGAPTTSIGAASPYPIPLTVAGLTGTITSLSVRLNGLTHSFPADLDMLLVGPGGQHALFMSDIGGDTDVSNMTLTFEDGAAVPSSPLESGTFAPTDLAPGDVLPPGAVPGPYTTAFSVFNGTNPNGVWGLYVADDASDDAGSLASYSLIVTTASAGGDYASASSTLTFPPGTTSQSFAVSVLGDSAAEPDESFIVNLSGATNAVIGDGQGVGTILNDDGVAPTATADSFVTPFATALTIAAPGVLGNDTSIGGDPLSAQLVNPTTHGTLNLLADGGFTYTPAAGFVGGDSFTYRAQTGSGASSADAVVTLTVNQPTTAQPATGLYVAGISGSRVTLRWTPPVLGPTPTGYVLEGGVTPGSVLGTLSLGPLPIVTFDAPDASLFVRLRTVAGGSTSPASNEVPMHVNVPVAPSAPAALLGMVNGTTLALSWRNTFGGGAPTGAVLDVTGTVAGSIPLGAVETFSYPGVPGGSYTFSVRSTNAAGSGPPSNTVSLSFPGACSDAPQTPVRFMAYVTGATVNVIWEPPSSGSAATSYVLGVTGSFIGALPMAATSFSAPAPPGTYTLSVRAVNECGTSPATAAQTVVVP